MRHLSRLIVVISFFLSISTAHAVQALREPRTFVQPDGSTVTLTLVGDEFYSFYLTEDNRIALRGDDGGYYYAEVDPTYGTPRPSDVLVTDGSLSAKSPARFTGCHDTQALQEAIAKARSSSTRLMRRNARMNAPMRAEPATTTSYSGKGRLSDTNFNTLTGSPHVLVILAEFSDYPFQTADAYDYFNGMLNTPGFSQYGATGSVSDYFKDASGNQFTPVFDVYGPVTLPNTRKYYGEQVTVNGVTRPDRDDVQMVIDAMTILDDTVDFSIFDNDGDGKIDNVFVIFAGLGQANGGETDAIWPNSWSLEYETDKNLTVDGKSVCNYGCSCEMRINDGQTAPDGIGTFCHEFSHVLGLPDEYDIYYGEAWHDHITPGPYSIMDMGNNNNFGRTPPTYSLYQRNALGWASTTVIYSTSNRSLRLGNIIDTNNGILLSAGSSDEFFLFENRQNRPGSWDEFLPGHGMLVWHITYNYNAWNYSGPNTDFDLQRVDIIEANNDPNFDEAYALAQYPYPGTLGKSAITPSTTPALVKANGDVMPTSITEIKENPLSSYITLVVNDGSSPFAYAPVPSVDGFEVKASPFRAKNGYDLELTPVNATDVVRYIYKGLDGETIGSGTCNGAVHISAPGSIEYWASSNGRQSEHCNIDLAFTVADVAISPAGGSFAQMPIVTLASGTTDPDNASVYYTTDGSVPSPENGMLYDGPFTPEGECTVKAIATIPGWQQSNVTEATFLIAHSGIKVDTPVLFPESGAVADKTVVTAACDTEDAVIRYTTDGSEPTEASTVFPADGLMLRKDVNLCARAFKDDCESSELANAAYTILPGNGSFKLLTDVSLLAPDVQIIIAARDKEVAMSHTETVSTNPGIAPTPIEKLGKTVEPGDDVLVITLQDSGTEGQYLLHGDGAMYVAAISSSSNSLGFRTLEEAGSNAAASFEIKEGATYIVTHGNFDRNNIRCDNKFGFVACSAGSTKPVVEVYYRLPIAAPAFSPEPGYVHAGDVVTVIPPFEGAVIRYTTDGTIPTDDSPIFPAEGLAIDEPTFITAKVFDGDLIATLATADYQIIDDSVAYRLLTSSSDLREGDWLIITHIDGAKAMSTTGNSFNRAPTEIDRQGDSVLPNDNVQILRLEAATVLMEGTPSPQWRLNVDDNKYLYADSSDGNSIRIGTLDDAGYNANATIDIEDGVATVTFQGPSTHNSLHVTNSGYFLCFLPTSPSPKVALYTRHNMAIVPEDNNNEFGDRTGIEDLSADAATRYYTLQGIPVHSPAPGQVYIVVRGSAIPTKTLLR